MQIVERGTGTPIVLIPGIQGRWAYMRPAVDALARSFRVITFDLAGERGAPPYDASRGLDCLADAVRQVLDRTRLERAVICGVSFGGLIALRFAAAHRDRTAALVLVSTPGPGFRLRPRHLVYTRAPLLFGPLFLAEVPRRLRAELLMALPGARERWQFSWRQAITLLAAPVSLTRMAARARLIGATDPAADCARVGVPTLVVHGESALDHVVSADGSSAYAQLIANARAVRIAGTGHLGYITRPDTFASLVAAFVASNAHLTGDRHDAA